MRSKITMATGALVFLASSLLEVASISGTLKQLAGPRLAESLSTRTIFLAMLGGLIVLAVAWFDRKVERNGPAKPNHATSDVVTSNIDSAPIQNQTANPVTTQSVEIHNYPLQTQPKSEVRKENNEPRYNIKFLGLKSIKTADLWTEVALPEDGFWAVKAGFLNQSIPHIKIDNYESVRARVVFYDSGGQEIFSTSKPVWLGHEDNARIHLDVNTPEYLLLAVLGNECTWAVPFTTIRPNGYWEYGEHTMIEGHSISAEQGPFKVEITLVGKDNVGLEPFTELFDLDRDGNVRAYPR